MWLPEAAVVLVLVLLSPACEDDEDVVAGREEEAYCEGEANTIELESAIMTQGRERERV